MRERILVGTIMLAAAFAVLSVRPGLESPAQFTPDLEKARDDKGELGQHNCQALGKQVTPLVCAYGPKGAGKRVVLFGDSHALQWGPALIPLARKHGWRFFTVLRAACPVADVAAESNCTDWRKRAFLQVERLKPSHIIISTSVGQRYRLKHQGMNLTRKASEPKLRSGMARTIKRLKRIPSLVNGGNAITLIRDQIVAPFVPAECLKSNGGRLAKCVFPKQRQFGPGFDWVAAREAGVGQVIDPVEALCGREWCSSTKGKILKYRDSDHITATYARTLSTWFDRRLKIY